MGTNFVLTKDVFIIKLETLYQAETSKVLTPELYTIRMHTSIRKTTRKSRKYKWKITKSWRHSLVECNMTNKMSMAKEGMSVDYATANAG